MTPPDTLRDIPSNKNGAAHNVEDSSVVSSGDVERTRSLAQCVEDAMEHYFVLLDGHDTAGLYDLVVREVEAPMFRAVMAHTRNNQSKAAELLGLNRGTLRKKLKLYDLL